MSLGTFAVQAEDWETAERHFLAAEQAFPRYPEAQFSAERQLAQVYEKLEREDERFAVLERWLEMNSDDFATHVLVARRHAEKGRHEQAVRLFDEANQIDPFRRKLHLDWGASLAALARHEEALREFKVAEIVPPSLDPDAPDAPGDAERAKLFGLQARELLELERKDEAVETAKRALALDPEQAEAKAVLDRLGIAHS
jgi:tetratricopeptide (TPR) repeat protein